MIKLMRLLLIVLPVAGFWFSCGQQENSKEEVSEDSSSEPQGFGLSSKREVSSVYAETVVGTPVTIYYKDFFALSPAAQQIVRNHEKVHQKQNPFLMSHPCREVEAYRLQLIETKIWLQQNNGDKRIDKEANEVHGLFFDAQELIETFQAKCQNRQ